MLSTRDLCRKQLLNAMNEMLLESGLKDGLLDDISKVRSNIDAVVSFFEERESTRIPQREAEEHMRRSYGFHSFFRNLRKLPRVVEKRLQRYEGQLQRLDGRIRRFNPSLELIEEAVVLRCPRCAIPVLRERESHDWIEIVKGELEEPVDCYACAHRFGSGDARRTKLHFVKSIIREVWKEDLWMEAYMSKLLQLMGWQTRGPRVYVLGSSGVEHEIDVLGNKKGFVLACECKTGKIERKDVFNFWAKVQDIRSHVSVLALIGRLPESQTREFVSKNLSMVLLENLGQKSQRRILRDMRRSALGMI